MQNLLLSPGERLKRGGRGGKIKDVPLRWARASKAHKLFQEENQSAQES